MTMRKKMLGATVLVALLFPLVAMAGKKIGTPKCWTVPAVFTGDEEVSFYAEVWE